MIIYKIMRKDMMAIVRDIANLHGATLALGRADNGGLKIEAAFEIARAES